MRCRHHSLEGLPDDVIESLTALEALNDQSLWRVMGETVSAKLQRERLTALQQQADLVMLRKARAAVLLRFRGKRIPTLAELGHLTGQPT